MNRYAVVFPDGSMSVMAEAKTLRGGARLCRMAIEERDAWNERERASKSLDFAQLASIELSRVVILKKVTR